MGKSLALTDSLGKMVLALLPFMQRRRSEVTSAISIRPAQKMSNRRCLWEIGVEHPINYERRILIRRVLWTNYHASEKVSAVFVSPNND